MSEIKTLFFDESGYTGMDLLNPDQPFFSVVSSDIESNVAEKILKCSFPHYRGKEFKFTNIWRKPTNRVGLARFAKELSNYNDGIFSWVADKRFVVLTKIVDCLVEPTVTAAGRDFYANGYSRRYANRFHFVLSKFWNKEQYDRLLAIYFQFSRDPNETNLVFLQGTLHDMVRDCPEELKPFLENVALGVDTFYEHSDMETFASTNEIQLSAVLASISYWRNRSVLDFSIIHDESSNFFKQIEMWQAITSPEVPKQVLIDGKGIPVEYPLRVVSTEPGDSKEHWTIQLCDMVAGLLSKVYFLVKTGEDKDYIEMLVSQGLGQLTTNGVRPGDEFIQGPPSPKNGPDVVDQITTMIFKK